MKRNTRKKSCHQIAFINSIQITQIISWQKDLMERFTFIRVKRSQIYRGNVKGIGDNKYKILPNEDARYGFIDEEHGMYLDIYFN